MQLMYPGEMMVDPASGAFIHRTVDLSLPCRGNLQLTVERHTNSLAAHPANVPVGQAYWSFNFNERLRLEYEVGKKASFEPPAGADVLLYPVEGSNVVLRAATVVYPNWATERFVATEGGFAPVSSSIGTVLTRQGGGFALLLPASGWHYFGSDGILTGVADLCGNRITYTWSAASGSPFPMRTLQSITDPVGRKLTFHTTPSKTTVTDWTGRTLLTYYYDGGSVYLSRFVDADNNTTTYRYANGTSTEPVGGAAMYPMNSLYKIEFPNGEAVALYQTGVRPFTKRVAVQVLGGRMTISYLYDTKNLQTVQLVGDADTRIVYQYDESASLVSVTDPLGNVNMNAYTSTGALQRRIDPRLGVTSYDYDSHGHLSRVTDAAGSATSYEYDGLDLVTRIIAPGLQAAVTNIEYDPTTALKTAETDALGNTVRYAYDGHGQLIAVTRKGGAVDRFTYDSVNGRVRTHTDPLGNVTQYGYDVLGRLSTVISPEGRTRRCVYTASGLLSSVTDGEGNTTTMGWDGNRNLVSVTDSLGAVTRRQYNNFGELVSSTDALGATTTYSYDASGNLMQVTDPLGRASHFTYDVLNRQVSSTDALGNSTVFTHDPYCANVTTTDALGRSMTVSRDIVCRVSQVVAPDGGVTSHAFNPDSTLASVTDPLGNTTMFEYDLLRRPVAVHDPLGNTTRMVYDADGNVRQVTDARGASTAFTRDAGGQVTSIQRRDGSTVSFTYSADGLLTAYSDSRGRTWSTRYDRCGRPVAKRDPLDHGSSIRYDALGQVQRALDALGETASFRYDATGRLVGATDPMGNSTSAVYDAVGNLQVAFDALDRATHHVYDALDRRVSTVDPSGGLTQVSYDAVGRPTAITDPGGRTMRYAYDVLDRPVAEIHPDGSRVTHAWDANGNLLSSTDPRGFTTTYRYGPANRLLEVVRPDSTAVQLTYDANGNIMTTTDSTGTYSFAYDAEDRPLRITHDDRSFNLTYDGDGRILSLAYPDHRVVRWTYDDVGRVASVTMPDHGLTSFAYDAADRRTGVSFGNGTTALAEYDFNSRLVRLVHQLGAANVTPDLRYAHDAAGNVSSVSDGSTPLWTYGYDSLNQLVSAVDEQTSTTTTWSYDRSNNISSVTVNGVTTPYTCNELNQLTAAGATELTWDGNGNLSRKVDAAGVTSYHFDSQDRLVEVSLPSGKRVAYAYDSRGRLVSRTSDEGTTTFEWVGWQLEREIGPSGRAMRFFYSGQQMVGFEMEAAYYTVHSDSQGHVRAVTDSAGAAVYSASYDAWGKVLSVADSVPGGWFYVYMGAYGCRLDADTGLVYCRHRWLDTSLQRFITRDVLRGANRYNYANNSPTAYVDVTGLEPALTQAQLNIDVTMQPLTEKVSDTVDYFHAHPVYATLDTVATTVLLYAGYQEIRYAWSAGAYGLGRLGQWWSNRSGTGGGTNGTGTIYAYSGAAMQQHFGGGNNPGHFSVETVGEETLHTHMANLGIEGIPPQVFNVSQLPSPTGQTQFMLSDVAAAQNFQKSSLAGLEPQTTCLDHAANVIRMGGGMPTGSTRPLPPNNGSPLIKWAIQTFLGRE